MVSELIKMLVYFGFVAIFFLNKIDRVAYANVEKLIDKQEVHRRKTAELFSSFSFSIYNMYFHSFNIHSSHSIALAL